jgi:unsaturated rhamnogalacturonyl hydrolase
MKTHVIPSALVLFACSPLVCLAAPHALQVECANRLPIAREAETIELSAKDLAPLGAANLDLIHIKDASGKEVVCQAVDNDFDARHTYDAVVFQADFTPGETKSFEISVGGKQAYRTEQYKAHGRFVRERFDDFAWENDRIAHRMYGKALETWAGEPLTSSTVDIWSKRVPRMVADEWCMTDNYHQDSGLGADFYSAGTSRGCGGNGLWASDALHVSKNFTNSRVLANGTIRVMFELDYDAFDVDGVAVSETKRITLDAGSNLDHFQSHYKTNGVAKPLLCGIGIRKTPGATKEFNAAGGMLAVWEPVSGKHGMQGVGVLADPKTVDREAEDTLNHLVLAKVGEGNAISYWAGFCWDQTGPAHDFETWKKMLVSYQQRLASPIVARVIAK